MHTITINLMTGKNITLSGWDSFHTAREQVKLILKQGLFLDQEENKITIYPPLQIESVVIEKVISK